MSLRKPPGWQWDTRWHPAPPRSTIVVTEPSDEQKAERDRKIAEGADVVPFGFGRVLHERTVAPAPALEPGEDAWEGQGL